MSILLAIIAFVWIYTLSKRVDSLESRLKGGVPQEKKVVPMFTPEDFVPPGTVLPTAATEVAQTQSSPSPSEPDILTRFFEWVRVDFMVKLGAFLLLCALGWFVSYAFMNDLIGEAGRITLGLITGAIFLGLGYWRMQTQTHQGGIFTVLGSTTVLLTVYAARELYGFFTPTSALFLMFFSTAFVALVAVRFNSERIAIAGLLLASIAPFFTNSPYPDVVERFTYLLVVVFGSLWIVYLRGWSTITLGALIVVFLHGMPYLTGIGKGDTDIVLLFTFVFAAIFFVANILGLIANENEENRVPHLLIGGGTGLYLILWIFLVAPKEWQSLLFVAWMLVFTVGSYLVYRLIERPEPFYIYGATSIALLGAATASELTGDTLTIAYTLEIGALVLLATRLMKSTAVPNSLTLLFVLPILASFEAFASSDWSIGVLHSSFFVLTILALTLSIAGVALYERAVRERSQTEASVALLVTALIYVVALVWLVLHAGKAFTYDTATLFALLVYAVAGILALRQGRLTGSTPLRYVGGALIGLVVARLLLVEVWNMALTGRIVTFFIMGLLFLSTAFLRKQSEGSAVSNNQN
jgi:uncharacterized membrane protein